MPPWCVDGAGGKLLLLLFSKRWKGAAGVPLGDRRRGGLLLLFALLADDDDDACERCCWARGAAAWLSIHPAGGGP